MKIYLVICFLLFGIHAHSQSRDILIQDFNAGMEQLDSMSSNQPALSFEILHRLNRIASELKNDSLQFTVSYKKALVLSQMGIFDQTLNILYDLLPMMENKQLRCKKGEVFYNIAATYFAMKDFQKYMDFNVKAKEAFISCGRLEDTLAVDIEMALAWVGLDQPQRGIDMLKRILQDKGINQEDENYAIALDNLSNAYYEMGEYQKALEAELQISSLPYAQTSIDVKAGLNQHLAEIYIQLKQYSQAQKHLDTAIIAAQQMGSLDWLFDCYKNQSAIFEAQGNYRESLRFHQMYLKAKDSVYQKQYDAKMSAMAAFYELGEKQNQITHLKEVQQLNQAKIQRLSLIIIILILLVVILILFVNHRKNKLERKWRQAFSAQLIQTQEDERQRISKELHDSVGQNLLFIKNQIYKLLPERNPLLNQSVDLALEEVRNISKDLYPNQLEQYGLISAVENLCDKVKESTNLFVSSDMNINEIQLNKRTKINCYRIIQECINNTIKHARATAIRITAELRENSLELVIQDNGQGFEKNNIHHKAQRSFGLLNLQERAALLHGRFELETQPGHGTKSTFRIPLHKQDLHPSIHT
jgi:signal transduction histidine kinase